MNNNTSGFLASAGSAGTNSNVPKAYLTYVFFDQDFNYQSSASGFVQVNGSSSGAWNQISANDLIMPESGYLYVYLSNEGRPSDGGNVYFDALRVDHHGGNVLQEDHYYPGGATISALSSSAPLSKPNQFKYQGKEFQTDFDFNTYDFHARMYDPLLVRTFQLDPMGEKFYDHSPYSWVKNNPILRIDPTGMTDFALNKKTGKITQVGEANDEPDRIVKTNRKGEIKYYKGGKNKGQAKTVISGIEKGILKNGQNFKNKDEVINVGGEGQPSLEGVQDFLIKFSENIRKEISGAYLSSEDGPDAKISKVIIDEYAGNKPDQAPTTLTSLTTDPNLEGLNTISHFHTHLTNIGKSWDAIESPSGRADLSGKSKDIGLKNRQKGYYNNFLIITWNRLRTKARAIKY